MTQKSFMKARKAILTNQIARLARIFLSRPVNGQNSMWHHRVVTLQCEAIREKKAI